VTWERLSVVFKILTSTALQAYYDVTEPSTVESTLLRIYNDPPTEASIETNHDNARFVRYKKEFQ
jgi:hypothetical protein